MTSKPDLVIAMADQPTAVNKTGSWRYERPVFRSRIGPCNEACPLGEDLNAILALEARGEMGAALGKISLENPFPGLSGRLCHHPCQRACNRGRFDQPVSIRDLESFVAKKAQETDPEPGKVRSAPGKKAAVVGAGPAGLAAAAFLARLGREVTLFNRGQDLAGPAQEFLEEKGLKEIWDLEAERVLKLGVSLERGCPRADDLEYLGREFRLIYVAPGGWGRTGGRAVQKGLVRSRELKPLIRAAALPSIRRPVVLGQGAGARAAAETLAGLGAEPLVLSPGPAPEVDTMDHGIEYADPTEVLSLVGSGRELIGLLCRRPGEEEPFPLKADLVVLALGERLDPVFEPAWSPPEGGFYWVDDHSAGPAGKEPLSGRMFMAQLAQGKGAALGLDLAAGQRPVHHVAQAMVGQRGALSLEAHLDPENGRRWQEVTPFEDLNPAAFKPSSPSRPAGEGGLLTPGQALRSARRCLGCGLCNFCRRCDDYCPDLSITIDPRTRTREIDYDHCKGCGICAEECPRGALAWVPEE